MQTSLKFLETGQPWPPLSEKDRLARYQANRQRFDGAAKNKAGGRGIKLLWDWVRGERDSASIKQLDYVKVVNFQKKISKKVADFLFIEPPIYTAAETKKTKGGESQEGEAGSPGDKRKDKKETEGSLDQNSDIINQIVLDSKLNAIGYSGAIDVSRYGEAIYVVTIEEKKATLTLSQPRYWFPVVEPDDIKKFKYHVIAYTTLYTGSEAKNKKEKEKEKVRTLHVQIHEEGKYTKKQYLVKDGVIEKQLPLEDGSEDKEVETGLDDFAVIPIQALVTSDTIFGMDDYSDINELVAEFETRLGQTSKILDKHAEPSMTGPETALDWDEESNEYTFKSGNFFPTDTKDDAPFDYITWDGKLEFSFKHMEQLQQLIGIISEMGPALFDTDAEKKAGLSGKALRFLFMDVLAKVSRFKNGFDDGYKQAIYLCSQVGYKEVAKDLISIDWQDGLPNDPEELATIANLRTGEKATDTVAAQIQKQDKVTEAEAEQKAEDIAIAEAASMAQIGSGAAFDFPIDTGSEGLPDSETPENIEAPKGLNGAQIKAAVDTLAGVTSGITAPAVAVELLVALGISKEKADNMVEAQKKLKAVDNGAN